MQLEGIDRGPRTRRGVQDLHSRDQVLRAQRAQCFEDGRALEAGAQVEPTPVAPDDTVAELVEADCVGIFLEAEGAPHDVQHDLELRASEIGHDPIEQLVGHVRRLRRAQAGEGGPVEGRERRAIDLGHRAPPLAQSLALYAVWSRRVWSRTWMTRIRPTPARADQCSAPS